MGKAIVSTTLGAEGLPISNGHNISIADSPEEFSRNVCLLLRDRVERDRLGLAARQLVEQHYSWSSVGEEFNDVLRRIAPERSSLEMHLPVDDKVSAARGVI